MVDTKQRLLESAMNTIRQQGIAATSARTIASAAGVNQALIFYHFGTVTELVNQACLAATRARVESFAAQLRQVTSLRGLLEFGRRMHMAERSLGNVDVLAQMLAAAQTDPHLAETTSAAMRLWIEPIEQTLNRILADSPVAALVDTAGLAYTISAGFVGLELFEGIDPAGAQSAMDTLDDLATLIDAIDELGPLTRRALRTRLGRPLKFSRSGRRST